MTSMQSGYIHTRQHISTISQRITNLLDHNPQKNTIPALDGVRAVACLMVLVFHLDFMLQLWNITNLGHLAIAIALSGDAGVTLFFVLSGFLLFLPYVKSLLFDSSWPSTRRFYLRRVFRIIPGYYVALFLMILLFHPEYLHPDHFKYLALFLTFFMDSTQATYQAINGPFWSLAVEWQFYLLLPLFALGMRLLVQRGTLQRRLVILLLCLLAIIVWGMVSRYEGAYLLAHPKITLFGSRTALRIVLFFLYGCAGIGFHGKFLEDFAVGMIVGVCYILATTQKPENGWNTWLRRLSPWLWGLGLIVLTLMAMWESNQANPNIWLFLKPLHPYYLWWREICLSIGFGICVLAILFDNAQLKRFFALPPMRWLGLISYSLYMWHLPLLLVFAQNIAPHLHLGFWKTFAAYWVWVAVAIIPFSLIFYLLVEKPWMRFSDWLLQHKHKARRAQVAPTSSPATSTSLLQK
jgi:peptidoglycan/LPS O-acetylase OafA/YrhL